MNYLKWINKNCISLIGKNVIVTGANSGIGFETSKVLAYLGANVIMACRSIEKANKAKELILTELPNAKIDIFKYDQSDINSINEFVKNFTNKYSSLFALVNNAGIYHPANGSKASNGYPLTIMTNFLGQYYLTRKLLPYIKKQEECRIVFETSIAANFSKLKGYDYLTKSLKNTNIEYNISKCAVAKGCLYLKDELKDYTNIKVLLSHPGISATNIFASKGNTFSKFFKKLALCILPFFVHKPAKACLGEVYCVANANITSGTFVGPRGLFKISGFPKKTKTSKFINNDIDGFINEVNKCMYNLEEK